ncbi:MAG: hypothetical protein LWY06_11335 [Firmicutes bacterium]|nr:hypothetical protein [Bacillota bacterium]
MFDLISHLASQLFVNGVSLELGNTGKSGHIALHLKDFLIRNGSGSGIIIDDLSVYIENLQADGMAPDFNKASYIVEKLGVIISETWLNDILRMDKELEQYGIHNLRVKITGEKFSIIGTFKKVVSIGFSIDLKFMVEKNIILVNFDRFWAGDLLPLPRGTQKLILGIIQKRIDKGEMVMKGIKFRENFIIIDPLSFIPVDLYVDIKGIALKDGYIGLRCETDREQYLTAIERKKLESENGENETSAENSPDSVVLPGSLEDVAGKIGKNTGKNVTVKESAG